MCTTRTGKAAPYQRAASQRAAPYACPHSGSSTVLAPIFSAVSMSARVRRSCNSTSPLLKPMFDAS